MWSRVTSTDLQGVPSRVAWAEDFPGIVVTPIAVLCAIFGHWARRGPWTARPFAAPWTSKGWERNRPVLVAAAGGAKRRGDATG